MAAQRGFKKVKIYQNFKPEDFREWWNGLNEIRNKIQNGKRNVQQGQYDDAMIEYESILDKHPYFPEAHFYMGLTKFRQKDIEQAAYYFSEALKIFPDHIKARKGLKKGSFPDFSGDGKTTMKDILMARGVIPKTKKKMKKKK